MRRRFSLLGVSSLIGIVVVLGLASAGSAALPPQWSPAIEVPGMAALNVGQFPRA